MNDQCSDKSFAPPTVSRRRGRQLAAFAACAVIAALLLGLHRPRDSWRRDAAVVAAAIKSALETCESDERSGFTTASFSSSFSSAEKKDPSGQPSNDPPLGLLDSSPGRSSGWNANELEWEPADCDGISSLLPLVSPLCDTGRGHCSPDGCHWFASGTWRHGINVSAFITDVNTEVVMMGRSNSPPSTPRTDAAAAAGHQGRGGSCSLRQLGQSGHVKWVPLPTTSARGRPRRISPPPSASPSSAMRPYWPSINVTLRHDWCDVPRLDEPYEHLVQLTAIGRVRGLPAGRHPIVLIRGDSVHRAIATSWVNIFRRMPAAMDRYNHADTGYVVTTRGDYWCRGPHCWKDLVSRIRSGGGGGRRRQSSHAPSTTTETGRDDDGSPVNGNRGGDRGDGDELVLMEVRYLCSVHQPWGKTYATDVRPSAAFPDALILVAGAIYHQPEVTLPPLPYLDTVFGDDVDYLRSGAADRRATPSDDPFIAGHRMPPYQTMIWKSYHQFAGGPALPRSPLPVRCKDDPNTYMKLWMKQISNGLAKEFATNGSSSSSPSSIRPIGSSGTPPVVDGGEEVPHIDGGGRIVAAGRFVFLNATDLYDYQSRDVNFWGGPTDFHSACILRDAVGVTEVRLTRRDHLCWNVHDYGLIQLIVGAAAAANSDQ